MQKIRTRGGGGISEEKLANMYKGCNDQLLQIVVKRPGPGDHSIIENHCLLNIVQNIEQVFMISKKLQSQLFGFFIELFQS